MTLRINWVCELPTHYNDFLFNQLSREAKIDLVVYYIYDKLNSHPWKTNNRQYRHTFLNKLLKINVRLIARCLYKKDEIFILGGWKNPTIVLIILTSIILGKRYVIWTDTPNMNQKKTIKNRIRLIWISFVLKNAYSIWGTGLSAIKNLILLGAPKSKTYNFPYFTDTEVFKPYLDQKLSSPFIFLSSGRLKNDHKGFDLAVQALGILSTNYPEFKFKYYIAGVGPDEAELIRTCKKYKIEGVVNFLGWLDLNDLEEFYKKGNFFIHPARYEPFGVSVVEAMASGLIVIGSDNTGAIIDRIVDGENGFVHMSESVEDLYSKLLQVVNLSESRLEIMRTKSLETSNNWKLDKGVNLIYKYLCVE